MDISLQRVRRKAGRLFREWVPHNPHFRPLGVHPSCQAQALLPGSGLEYRQIHAPHTSHLNVPAEFRKLEPAYDSYPDREDVGAAFALSIHHGRIHADNPNSVAVIGPDNYLLGEVSFQYESWGRAKPEENNIFQQQYFVPPLQIDGTVCSMLSGGAAAEGNYFHWIVDSLPRLHLIKEAGWMNEVDYFLVYNPASTFMLETLAPLGIGPERLLSATAHPHVQAERLLVTTHVRGMGYHLPMWAVDFLRESYLPAPRTRTFSPYVYVSRRDASFRHVLNEAEVLNMLGPEFGFESYALSELSFAEKVELFSQAKAIISPIGAGLSNVLFAPPGTPVLELMPASYCHADYLALCHRMGQRYDWLSCPVPEVKQKHHDHTVATREHLLADVPELRRRVERMLAVSTPAH